MARTDFEVSQFHGAGRPSLNGTEEGLVAYWPLNEGAGKRIRDLKDRFHGEWNVNVGWDAEKNVMLPGGRVWGLVSHNPSFDAADKDFSVVCFYRSSTPPEENHINAATLMLSSPNLFGAGWSVSLRRTTIACVVGATPDPHSFSHEFTVENLFDGQWHCIAMTRNKQTVHCYFDGREVGTFASDGPAQSNRGEIVLGGVTNWSLGLAGNLRDCSYWNRALTPAEVASLAAGSSEMSAEILAPQTSRSFSARVLDAKGNEVKGAATIPKDTAKVALARLPVGSYWLEVKDETTGKTATAAFRVWRYDMKVSPTGVLQGRPIGVRVLIEGPEAPAPHGLKLRVVGTNLAYDVKGAGETDINTSKLDEGEYEVELVDQNLDFTRREKFRVWK